MRQRLKAVLVIASGLAAALWAAVNLHQAFAREVLQRPGDKFIGSAFDVPEFVLLLVLIALLRVNVCLTARAARCGRGVERCRIAHFWVTVGCICIAFWNGVLSGFYWPVDSHIYPPSPTLAALEACLWPIQTLFAGCILALSALGTAPRASAAAAKIQKTSASNALLRMPGAILGSPVLAQTVVTVLVVGILADVWWTAPLLHGWTIVEWSRIAVVVAVVLGLISAIGSRGVFLPFSAIVLGILAGSTWAEWNTPNDVGSYLWRSFIFVLTTSRDLVVPMIGGAAIGCVIGTGTRHMYLKGLK
jgi:hypothetical protein